MAIEIKSIAREFRYNGRILADPNPTLDLEQVQNIHATTHPELNNAGVDGPELIAGKHIYTYHVSAGTKG